MKKSLAMMVLIVSMLLMISCSSENPDNGNDDQILEEDPVIDIFDEERGIVNNGGHYVKYNGDVYYREYLPGSFEEVALWHDFPYDPYGISRIVKLSKDGEKEIVWEGFALGGFFIYENIDGDILFAQNKFTGAEDGTAHYGMNVETFVVNMEGETLFEYEAGSVYQVDPERRMAIIEGYRNNIEVMDMESGAIRTLTDPFRSPLVYDAEDGILYYENYEPMAMFGEETYTISTININGGQQRDLLILDLESIKELFKTEYPLGQYEFVNPRLSGDYLLVYMAGYEGTGNFLGEYELLKIQKKGESFEIEAEPAGINWFGPGNVFNPRGDTPFYMDVDAYMMYDGEDARGAKTVLSAQELIKLGYEGTESFDEEHSVSLKNIEYLDGELFFTVVEGEREQAEDIGWRYAYRLKGAKTYKKDMNTGEIRLIYEY